MIDSRSAGVMRLNIPALRERPALSFETRKHLLRVLMEDLFLMLRVQPRDAFDEGSHVVVPLAGARIGLGARAGTFRAE
jgi:hypothetical protein